MGARKVKRVFRIFGVWPLGGGESMPRKEGPNISRASFRSKSSRFSSSEGLISWSVRSAILKKGPFCDSKGRAVVQKGNRL